MSEARRRELLELGFPDDGYDYLRHMRTMGVGGASLEGVGGEAAGRSTAAPEAAAAAGAHGGGGRCCMDHARGRAVRRGAERAGACGVAQSVLRGLRRTREHAGACVMHAHIPSRTHHHLTTYTYARLARPPQAPPSFSPPRRWPPPRRTCA